MKPLMRILALFLCLALANSGRAQTYNVTVENRPFTFLENPSLAVQGAWDDLDFQVPLGFDFEFFDIVSDHLYAAPNTFGGYTSLNQDEEHLYMLMHFYASLIDRGSQQDSALSPISYKTEGLAGHRVFTLEYNNAGLFHGREDDYGVFLDYINLQVRLYEASGDIEFHIGPWSILADTEDVFDGEPGPFVGLFANTENTPGGAVGEVILLSGDPLSPEVVTDPYTLSTLTWPIPENTVYRFSRMPTSADRHSASGYRGIVFPNPTTGDLYLDEDILNDIHYPVAVLDALGRHVAKWTDASSFSAADLAPGTYFILLQIQEKLVTEKLVVLSE